MAPEKTVNANHLSSNVKEPSVASGAAVQLCTEENSPTESQSNAHGEEQTHEYISGIKLVIVATGIALALFLVLIDTIIISTAIPRITDEFKSLEDVGWYASAYQFGGAIPLPLAGNIYTRFKLKWSFLMFFLVFEFGSVLCGAARSSTMLTVGRAIAGVGCSGILSGAITILSACVPLEKRASLLGFTVGSGQIGLAVGPLIGGAFTTYATWRWCFYINLPVGVLVAIAVSFIHIPEQLPKERALHVFAKLHHYLDLIGFILFAPAVLQLLLALQYGGDKYAWNSSQVIGLFVGSAATFLVWFLWNYYKGDDALIPQSMLHSRIVLVSGMFQGLWCSTIYIVLYYLPIYFQAVNNASAFQSGVYYLPTVVLQLFGSALAGAIITKTGYLVPVGLVATVLGATGCGLYSLLRPGTHAGWWVGFQLISGTGFGLGLYLTLLAVPAEQLPSAIAFVIFLQSLGPSIFLTLSNIIFLQSLRSQISQNLSSADAAAIINSGATQFRAITAPHDLAAVLTAYAVSIGRVCYLAAAIASICAILCWGLGWSNFGASKKSTTGSNTISVEGKV
ncbi:major facilitator superfamily domain-containing protein [Xylaria bambusicola]|uniref:major facilitator superfamily domain-containing protein n=1 Tax=Xylaria bambusicola TaxID=326684 RepID=UPI002007825D|nr:major facilitator superfamily domain-containing protein [Xylaria bambusicola]KAI0521006.1 major facilitator superfamily domain-containing protein [Xylaria bambusicola]